MSKLKKPAEHRTKSVKKPRDWGWASRLATIIMQTAAFLVLIVSAAYGLRILFDSLIEPLAYTVTSVIMLAMVYIIFKK